MSNPVKTITRQNPPYPFEAYAYILSPLSAEDGGGFMVSFPDLPGCISDGETEIEAVANGRDAFATWVSACIDAGRAVPAPSFRPDSVAVLEASGKFVTRVPKSVHAQLTARARQEGVSLNSLVLTFIAEGLGRREFHA